MLMVKVNEGLLNHTADAVEHIEGLLYFDRFDEAAEVSARFCNWTNTLVSHFAGDWTQGLVNQEERSYPTREECMAVGQMVQILQNLLPRIPA